MKYKKVYMQVDSIKNHRDFNVWYEDGDLFLSFTGTWTSEHDRVTIFGRMGGEMGCIKPNPNSLFYYIKLERWEYVFHTIRLFEQYYVEGMLWQIEGTLTNPPFSFNHEGGYNNDVRVSIVNFQDKGDCYQISVRDVEKLRIATAAVVAMAIKEEYKGLSEGAEPQNPTLIDRAKRFLFSGKGITYEQLLKEEVEAKDKSAQ